MRNIEVPREMVLEYLKTASVALSTVEIARILKVRERCVRSAIFWLHRFGYVKQDDCLVYKRLITVKKKLLNGNRKIHLYRWTGKSEPLKKMYSKGLSQADIEKSTRSYNPKLLDECMMAMRNRSVKA